jgi:hypothetical protein
MTGHNLITPTHRSIRKYYEHVSALQAQGVLNEMNVRSPFESLLQETARLKDWTFIAELSGKSGGAIIRPNGTLRDRNSLPRGYWEAKDTQDDLDTEIKRKIARGYPLSNIIFEDTQTGGWCSASMVRTQPMLIWSITASEKRQRRAPSRLTTCGCRCDIGNGKSPRLGRRYLCLPAGRVPSPEVY